MRSIPAFRLRSLLLCGLLGAGVSGSAIAQSTSGAQGLLNDKWVFNLGTMGGIAAATPDPSAPLAPQLKRLIIGGPLASLVLAVVGLALALGFEGRAGAYGVIVGAMSLLIFLVTATPLRAGGFMSDGLQYLELRRGGAAVNERQVLLRMMGSRSTKRQ